MRCSDPKEVKLGKSNSKALGLSPKTENPPQVNIVASNLVAYQPNDQVAKSATKPRPESSPAKSQSIIVSDIAKESSSNAKIPSGNISKKPVPTSPFNRTHVPFADKLEAFSQEIAELRKQKHKLWSLKATPRPLEEEVRVSDIKARLQEMKVGNCTPDFVEIGSGQDRVTYYGGLGSSPDSKEPVGYGYLKFSHGGHYLGCFSNGVPHGDGREVTKSGSLYIGQFVLGQKHGAGRLWSQSDQEGNIFYEGSFSKGKKDGQGVYVTQSGYIYSGLWRSDLQEGSGAELLPNGNFYSGNFSQGVKHGSGHLFTGRENEKVCWGSWVFGQKNGEFNVYDGQDTKPAQRHYRGGLPVI